MKKMVLIAGLGLLTTAGVTAAVLSNNKKATTKNTSKKECTYKKDCATKKECSKKTACYY